MKYWKITALYFGSITVPKSAFTGGLDPDLIIKFPIIGYLLRNGEENILVDTGINDARAQGGAAELGGSTEGGREYVLKALSEEGLAPEDIDAVIYTHLHVDHAGNVALFRNARIYYQKEEYCNLMHPLPTQKDGYDVQTLRELSDIPHPYVVDGDLVLPNGLELYRTPGHTSGSMSLRVATEEGQYILTGDTAHCSVILFPQLTEMELLDGEIVPITPHPDKNMPYVFSSLLTDQYSAYDSLNRLKCLAPSFEPKWYLTGHDCWIINRKYFG